MKPRFEQIAAWTILSAILALGCFSYFRKEASIGEVPPCVLGKWKNVTSSTGGHQYIFVTKNEAAGINLSINKVSLIKDAPYTIRLSGQNHKGEPISYIIGFEGDNLIHVIECWPATQDRETTQYLLGRYAKL